MIYLLIINPNQFIRHALQERLEQVGNISVLYQAQDQIEAAQILANHSQETDIIILDTHLGSPDPLGLQYAIHLRNIFPKIKILMMGFFLEGAYVYQMFEQGIHGFLLAGSRISEMLLAIQQIYQGGIYYENDIKRLLEQYTSYINPTSTESLLLTNAELALVQEMAVPEVAESGTLSMESPMGQMYWKNICYKLGTTDPEQVIDMCYRQGWLP